MQACANDPQVAVHAIRNLARIGFGTVAVRYSQLGFGRTSSTTRDQTTPRNLMGLKDGTNNLKAEDTEGNLLVDVDAHVRLVSPDYNGGIKMLRRGYNFTDGSASLGHLDAGLFFIAFVRNPAANFIPLLARMSNDALNEYITHTGTAVFACPPGLPEAADPALYWGSTLFD